MTGANLNQQTSLGGAHCSVLMCVVVLFLGKPIYLLFSSAYTLALAFSLATSVQYCWAPQDHRNTCWNLRKRIFHRLAMLGNAWQISSLAHLPMPTLREVGENSKFQWQVVPATQLWWWEHPWIPLFIGDELYPFGGRTHQGYIKYKAIQWT